MFYIYAQDADRGDIAIGPFDQRHRAESYVARSTFLKRQVASGVGSIAAIDVPVDVVAVVAPQEYDW